MGQAPSQSANRRNPACRTPAKANRHRPATPVPSDRRIVVCSEGTNVSGQDQANRNPSRAVEANSAFCYAAQLHIS